MTLLFTITLALRVCVCVCVLACGCVISLAIFMLFPISVRNTKFGFAPTEHPKYGEKDDSTLRNYACSSWCDECRTNWWWEDVQLRGKGDIFLFLEISF